MDKDVRKILTGMIYQREYAAAVWSPSVKKATVKSLLSGINGTADMPDTWIEVKLCPQSPPYTRASFITKIS